MQVQSFGDLVLQTDGAIKNCRNREQHYLQRLKVKCRDLEDELNQCRTASTRLSAECQQLASDAQESHNRSLVMEVGLKQVLEDSKNFAGTQEEVASMQRDLASSFVLIQKLCASIDNQATSDDDYLVDAIGGDIFGDRPNLKKRSVEACGRVMSMHSELLQVRILVVPVVCAWT